jgi:hypothetical protein
MRASNRRRSLVLVVALAVSAVACSSGSLSVKSLEPSDLASVAGTWQGTARGLLAESRPITMTINADGTFTTTGTVYATQGLVNVKNGGLYFAGGFQAGDGQAPNYVATAMLVEEVENRQVIQVLSGSGFSNGRSVTFLVNRPKT